jgi:CDP-4-dehydro-6-deoxyglucose reductase, E1
MHNTEVAMKSAYKMAVDTIDQNDLNELIDWLKAGPFLTQGKLVDQFQTEWAHWLGSEHGVYVNSGSSANLLMYYTLLASEELRNKKVIVPAISWATTVAPAIQFGFEPIMCDVEMDTFGLDPVKLEELLIEHDPASVILVHVLGCPCDLEAIMALKEKYNFKLMEDACAATGSTFDGKKVGTFGELGSYSFFFGHHVSTIEGGMVCSDNSDYNDLMLQLRSHGWAKDLSAEAEAKQADQYNIDGFNRLFTFYYPGFNIRASDLNARIGLSQMKKVDAVCEGRIVNHKVYMEMLTTERGFTLQHNERAEICSIACAALAESDDHRVRVIAALNKCNVETRPLGGGNMSRQPYWESRYGATDFANADRIAASAFQLPTHPFHSTNDIREICEVIIGA